MIYYKFGRKSIEEINTQGKEKRKKKERKGIVIFLKIYILEGFFVVLHMKKPMETYRKTTC